MRFFVGISPLIRYFTSNRNAVYFIPLKFSQITGIDENSAESVFRILNVIIRKTLFDASPKWKFLFSLFPHRNRKVENSYKQNANDGNTAHA